MSPGHQVLAILSSKWAGLVVEALAEGPRRHGRLAAAIAGASQKGLTQTLRALECDGVVVRTVVTVVPARVDYSLTALGRDFLQMQRHVRGWADVHAGEIAAARARHDRPATAVTESEGPSLRPADPRAVAARPRW